MSAHHATAAFSASSRYSSSLSEMHRQWAAGADPTGAWRDSLTEMNEQWYGTLPPPQVAGALVLQWLLAVLADTSAHGALAGPCLVDVAPGAITFDLAPACYPDRIGFAAVKPSTLEPQERLEAARAAYLEQAHPVAARYVAGARFGRHQRAAMVRDVWAMAEHAARSSHRLPAGAPPERESCCYIYVLPGAQECAACPRRRTQSSKSTLSARSTARPGHAGAAGAAGAAS